MANGLIRRILVKTVAAVLGYFFVRPIWDYLGWSTDLLLILVVVIVSSWE